MYQSMSSGPARVVLYALPSSSVGSEYPSNHYIHSYVGDYYVHFYNQCACLSGPLSLSSVLSIGDFPQESVDPEDWKLGKPTLSSYDARRDRDVHGPNGIAASWYRTPEMEASLFKKERPVIHYAFSGDVSDTPSDSALYGPVDRDTFFGTISGVERLNTSRPYSSFRAIGFTDEGFLEFETRENFSPEYATYHPAFEILPYIDRMLSPDYSSPPFYPGPGWSYEWSDYVNKSHRTDSYTHVDFSYQLHMEWSGGGETVTTVWSVHVDFTVHFNHVFGSNSAFDWNDVTPAVSITSDCEVSCISYRYQYAPTGFDGFFDPLLYTVAPDPLVFDLSIKALGLPNAVGAYALSGIRPFPGRSNLIAFRQQGFSDPFTLKHMLRRFWDLYEKDIEVSSFFSAADALEKHLVVLKANHLENLTQLSGSLDLIPNLNELIEIFSRGATGDPGIVLEVFDYISDAVLKFKFGQKPTADDVAEFLSSDIAKQLASLRDGYPYEIYGVKTWQLPVPPPFDPEGHFSLTSRSKIRITVDLSTLLATILSANSVGILPSLSRLWDLVPFSFVIDWFLNMGARIHNLDEQALWMCVVTKWCLHSYKLSYFPSQTMLEKYHLASSGEPFSLNVYVRRLSLYTPALRESRFDYNKAGPPNTATVGAFVYKLLRS